MPNRARQIRAKLLAANLGTCCVTNPFSGINVINDPRRNTWGRFDHAKNKTSFPSPDKLKSANAYLLTGKDLVKAIPWAGVCATFSCATSYLISELALGQSIELFSFGEGFNGHVFIVVGRQAGSAPENPATWGDAIVVDQWYAIQQNTPNTPTYKQGTNYMAWLTPQKKIKSVLQIS